jgi:hypothetical protein
VKNWLKLKLRRLLMRKLRWNKTRKNMKKYEKINCWVFLVLNTVKVLGSSQLLWCLDNK